MRLEITGTKVKWGKSYSVQIFHNRKTLWPIFLNGWQMQQRLFLLVCMWAEWGACERERDRSINLRPSFHHHHSRVHHMDISLAMVMLHLYIAIECVSRRKELIYKCHRLALCVRSRCLFKNLEKEEEEERDEKVRRVLGRGEEKAFHRMQHTHLFCRRRDKVCDFSPNK